MDERFIIEQARELAQKVYATRYHAWHERRGGSVATDKPELKGVMVECLDVVMAAMRQLERERTQPEPV